MNTIPPTPRQMDLLRFITGYAEAHGRMPSYNEMAAGVGLASRGAVHNLTAGLISRGHILREQHRLELLTAAPLPYCPAGQPLYFVPAPVAGEGRAVA